MLLALKDFPPGWVHKAADPGDDPHASVPAPLERCVPPAFVGQTGRAVGGEFSDENTTLLSINPLVYVFDSEEHAQIAARAITSEAQCFADVIGNGLDLDRTFAFGETHTEPLSADFFGATAAIRSFNTQVYKSENPPHSDVLVFDIVILVNGRVLSEVDGFQRHSPIDQALLQRYVDKARAKVRQRA